MTEVSIYVGLVQVTGVRVLVGLLAWVAFALGSESSACPIALD
jgi:hypothetical protein